MATYQCKRCGKVSGDKSGVCDPTSDLTSFYVCGDCNKQDSNSAFVCKPKEVTPAFYCKTCGSAGVDENKLCEPERLSV